MASPTLQLGAHGPDVARLQRLLNAGTSHLHVDGQFGPATERAVRAYQARHLIDADGVVGPQTWKHLNQGPHKHQRPLRLRALQHGRALLGVMEQGGNNTGPTVDKIIRANGGVIGEPWCGDFVAYCYRLAGSKAVERLWASVYFLGRVAGLYTVSRPEPGDIVRYNFDHTGMFVRWISGTQFEALEGNTGPSGAVSDGDGGDGVYLKRRHISQVSNFRRVSR